MIAAVATTTAAAVIVVIGASLEIPQKQIGKGNRQAKNKE